jgi:hypothetical protein
MMLQRWKIQIHPKIIFYLSKYYNIKIYYEI